MMITILLSLLFILSCATLDRLRGSGYFPGTKALFQVIYGLVVGVGLIGMDIDLASLDVYFLTAFTLCFTAGISIGWGVPFGDYFRGVIQFEKKEWWQFGSLPIRPFTSIVVRGIIWSACTAPCLLLNERATLIFMVAIILAFVSAAMIAKAGIKRDVRYWDWHEAIRGGLLGLLIVAGGLINV